MCDVKKDRETEKEVQKLKRMLVEPQNVVVPRLRTGAQKIGYHAGLPAMEGKNGVTDKAFDKLLKLEGNELPETI